MVEQSLPAAQQIKQPYPPSWVDRLHGWVNRLPAPPWVFYLCLWLLFSMIDIGSKWLDGVQPFGQVRFFYIVYPFFGIYFLAAMHYLDTWAENAYNSFHPTLTVGKEEQSLLLYQLTNMPARAVWIVNAATLVCLIVLIRPVIMPLWESVSMFTYSDAPASALVDLGLINSFNWLIIGVFIYHTVRQLRWIGRIHSTATRIDLFHLRPLYSLSGLTARTAGILLLAGYAVDQSTRLTLSANSPDPSVSNLHSLFSLMSLVFFSVLAVAVFFFPLLGLHQLLLREKERLQSEADTRLQAHIEELHRRLDTHTLQDADAINRHMNSLSIERDILAKLPTWPWQPGTLNLLLTAVLLPIILWVVQQVLRRWAGF